MTGGDCGRIRGSCGVYSGTPAPVYLSHWRAVFNGVLCVVMACLFEQDGSPAVSHTSTSWSCHSQCRLVYSGCCVYAYTYMWMLCGLYSKIVCSKVMICVCVFGALQRCQESLCALPCTGLPCPSHPFSPCALQAQKIIDHKAKKERRSREKELEEKKRRL